MGAVVGGGMGGLLCRLPGPLTMALVCPEGSGSKTSPPSYPTKSLTLPVTELLQSYRISVFLPTPSFCFLWFCFELSPEFLLLSLLPFGGM